MNQKELKNIPKTKKIKRNIPIYAFRMFYFETSDHFIQLYKNQNTGNAKSNKI